MKHILIILISILLLSSFLTSCTQVTKYEGEYKDGKRHGQGTFTHSDGGKYVGEWENDYPLSVIGLVVYTNGKKYVGNWNW